MSILDEIRAANERYAASFAKGELGAKPVKRLAVLTCMDARIDPARMLGLKEGDAHVIRNAGGIATDDAIRSLAVSHAFLGTEQAAVIGHTDCGMTKHTAGEARDRLGPPADGIDFLFFADVEESVRESVRRIRGSGLFPPSFRLAGFVYDVRTGGLEQVAAN